MYFGKKKFNIRISALAPCKHPLVPPAPACMIKTLHCGFTRTVDVHVDGFVVAFRLQKEQLGNDQTCHRVVDLSRGDKGST